VRDRLEVIACNIFVSLIYRDANLRIVDAEVELQALLFKPHLCLYHLCDLFEIVINRLLYVDSWAFDFLDEPIDLDEPLNPPAESQVTPPSLQALGTSILDQFLKRVLLGSLEPSPEKVSPPVALDHRGGADPSN
jgi:hypothetical protein